MKSEIQFLFYTRKFQVLNSCMWLIVILYRRQNSTSYFPIITESPIGVFLVALYFALCQWCDLSSSLVKLWANNPSEIDV